MNGKGSGRKWPWNNRDTVSSYFWRKWGKPRKASVRITGVPAGIRTVSLWKIILGCFRYFILLLSSQYLFVHPNNIKWSVYITKLLILKEPGKLSDCSDESTGWTTEESDFNSRQEKKNISLLCTAFRPALGVHLVSCIILWRVYRLFWHQLAACPGIRDK
jgi:hypothetical protein